MTMRPSISGSDDVHREVRGSKARWRRARPPRRGSSTTCKTGASAHRARLRRSSRRAGKSGGVEHDVGPPVVNRARGDISGGASFRLVTNMLSTAKPRAASASASASTGAVSAGEKHRAIEHDERARRSSLRGAASPPRCHPAAAMATGSATGAARPIRVADEVEGHSRHVLRAALVETAPDALQDRHRA